MPRRFYRLLGLAMYGTFRATPKLMSTKFCLCSVAVHELQHARDGGVCHVIEPAHRMQFGPVTWSFTAQLQRRLPP